MDPYSFVMGMGTGIVACIIVEDIIRWWRKKYKIIKRDEEL